MPLCDIIPQRHLTAARDAQLATLAPYAARELREHWHLTRRPRRTPRPPYAPALRPDALLRAAFPGTTLPRVIAGTLSLFTAGAGNYVSVSPAIPFPFEIVSITPQFPVIAAGPGDRLELLVIDSDPGADNVRPPGTRLYQAPTRAAGLTSAQRDIAFAAYGSFDLVLSTPVPLLQITEPGKRLAMFVTQISGSLVGWQTVYTVRELMHMP